MAILYPTSLANLVVEVGTRHCHQTLLSHYFIYAPDESIYNYIISKNIAVLILDMLWEIIYIGRNKKALILSIVGTPTVHGRDSDVTLFYTLSATCK